MYQISCFAHVSLQSMHTSLNFWKATKHIIPPNRRSWIWRTSHTLAPPMNAQITGDLTARVHVVAKTKPSKITSMILPVFGVYSYIPVYSPHVGTNSRSYAHAQRYDITHESSEKTQEKICLTYLETVSTCHPSHSPSMSAPWSEWCGCVAGRPLASLHHKWRHPSIPQSHPPAGGKNHRSKQINDAKVDKIQHLCSQNLKTGPFPTGCLISIMYFMTWIQTHPLQPTQPHTSGIMACFQTTTLEIPCAISINKDRTTPWINNDKHVFLKKQVRISMSYETEININRTDTGRLKSAIVAMCALRAAKARRVAKISFTPQANEDLHVYSRETWARCTRRCKIIEVFC